MGKSASGGYYAVAIGRATGVFTTWAQAEAQVKGFAGARYKKFPTQLQAEAFIAAQGNGNTTVAASPAVAPGRKRGRSVDETAMTASGDGTDTPNSKRHVATGSFYAVLEGHSTGVVASWNDVVAKTKGFDRPLYRKFDTREAADAYLAGYRQAREPPKKQYVAVDAADATDASEQSESPGASADAKSRGGFWYAVAKGRKTGVYSSWAEAKVQIDGLFSAKYKKFPTKAEAEAFVRDHEEATSVQTSDPDPKHPHTLVAFCDGSALQNGRFGCQAGYACIFPHNPSWNVAKKLVEDRATNNRAEYFAALEGMKRANEEDPSYSKPLFIFSDSMLLIRSMTEWIVGWQKKNWLKADGSPVLNRDLLEMLLKEKGSRRIIWRHVKAHTGRTDWMSKWNDVADHAARNAAAGWEPTSSA